MEGNKVLQTVMHGNGLDIHDSEIPTLNMIWNTGTNKDC